MPQNKIDIAVLSAAAQINPMIAAAAAIIQAVRGLRNSVAAAAPQLLEDGTLAKTDKELIAQFAEKAGLLKTESAELIEWLEAQVPPTPQPPQ
jgi:hypothetical protein